jgi:predicted RNase H-like HicB family nuclease
MRYTVLVDGEPGAYGVVFPELPGCTAMGDTIEEALDNAGKALRDWMLDYISDGSAPPTPKPMGDLVFAPDLREAVTGGAQFASVALVMATGKPSRANLTLDEGVLRAIDEAAKARGVTRSGMVELLAREHLPAL